MFQKLISARSSEANAFSLIRAIFGFFPVQSYANFSFEIFKILMLRLQSRMNGRMGIIYTKELILSLSIFIGKNGAMPLFESLEKMQAGMSSMLMKQIWIPNVMKIRGEMEKKNVSIAMTRIACEVPGIQADAECWGNLLAEIVNVLEEAEETTAQKDADDALLELEETGYEAGYSKLCFASISGNDLLCEIPSAKMYLATSLSTLSGSRPGVVRIYFSFTSRSFLSMT